MQKSQTIHNISDMNVQVAASAEEQSAVSDGIRSSIKKISETIDQTSEAVHEAQSASTSVRSMAEELSEKAASFKLS